MTFHLTHRYGNTTTDAEDGDLPALLQELEDHPQDSEHAEVAVTHESEWSISVSRGGYVVFEHLEAGGERHMRDVPNRKILELWRRLANGDFIGLDAEAWSQGY